MGVVEKKPGEKQAAGPAIFDHEEGKSIKKERKKKC